MFINIKPIATIGKWNFIRNYKVLCSGRDVKLKKNFKYLIKNSHFLLFPVF